MLLIGHIESIRSELSRNEITNSMYDSNKGRGWMATAKDALAGPAGQMVVHFAKEMISRSTGNSQVNGFYHTQREKKNFNAFWLSQFICILVKLIL